MKLKKLSIECILAEKGFNYSDLRKKGFSPSTIAKIRNGSEILPKTVGKIANVLGISVSDIVEREN